MKHRWYAIRAPRAIGVLSVIVLGLLATVMLYYLLPMASVMRAQSARQKHLLLETDYESLLQACRELMTRVDNGDLKPGSYFARWNPDAEVASFPGIILGLDPTCVRVGGGGLVQVELGGGFHCFGVTAFAAGWPTDNQGGDLRLIPDLWYYDSNLDEYPELRPGIERLVHKGIARNVARGIK